MNNLVYYLKRFDWILIISALLLVAIGLLSIYSSSIGRDNFLNFKKQIIFIVVGVVFMFLISFIDWRLIKENTALILIFYFLSIISLVGLFFFAPEIRGVKSWYKLGPFSLDPIEFTKIILIILLAKYFSLRHVEMYRFRHIIFSGIYVLIPAVLVFFQPEIGSILTLLVLWLTVLIISGIKIRHFLVLVFCGLIVLALCWGFLLKDYQKERVISFFMPYQTLGLAWSQNQAKIAIGSGGILGQGIGKGSQTQYGFLPEPQTDFIFSAIAEEMGLAGILAIFVLFLILIWRIIKIALLSKNNFSRLFASGFSVVIISGFFINIGINIGILPVVGVPLPLVSYGGSSLITVFMGMGILESIKAY